MSRTAVPTAGVGSGMAPRAGSAPWAPLVLAALLLADVPGAFTRGDVLRGALLAPVAGAALLLGLFASGRLRRPDLPALGLLLLPVALVLLSLPGVARPALASPAALARGAAPWLALTALTLGLWRLSARPGTLEACWRALLWAGAVAGAWVYVEALTTGRASAGPFGRPGVAGPLLGALLGPALGLPLARHLALRALAPVLLAAGVFFTHSRTGMAAAGLSVLILLASAPGLALPAGVRRAAGLAALLAALAAALLLTGVLAPPGAGTTLAVRQGVWRAGAALVAERPLTGHGLGSLRTEILRRRDLEEARLSRGREPFMAHNDALQAAVEGGLPAGLCFALFALGALSVALAAQRRSATPLGAAALAVVAALTAAGLAEQVLPDPAHVPLFALALATVLAGVRAATLAPPGRAVRSAGAVAALLLLILGVVKARDALADAHLAAYRRATAAGVGPAQAQQAASEHLVAGALRWRADHAEALTALGVSEAESGRLAAARDLFRRALALEPGLTEARLNLAQTFVEEDRAEDAAAALEAARAHDPTRYDVALRLGHVAYGPEPMPVPPGGADVAFSPFECLKRYNAAEELAPGRFETQVAYARVWRRVGDLGKAGEALRASTRAAAALLAGEEGEAPIPAEILLESFLLAEAEGRSDDVELANILTLALATDPALAASVRRQAARAESEGLAREQRAREEAPELTPPDTAPAARGYAALHRRVLGLLGAGLADADAVLREARAAAEAGRYRAAFARQHALLTYVGEAPPESAALRAAFFGRRANLLIEAAQTAARFDGALARRSYAEGHLLAGMELLETGRAVEAVRLLEKARDEAPEDPRPCVALARALARASRLEEAEAAALEALRRDPAAGPALEGEPDLASLLERPAVRSALGGEAPR